MYARIQFELLSANPLSQSQFRTQPPVQACLDLPLSFNRCRLFLLTPFPTSLTNPRHITPFPATLTKIHPGWHHSRLPRASRGHSPLITRHFLLTPLFPLLTRHISATPLFPTDTKNMGVGVPYESAATSVPKWNAAPRECPLHSARSEQTTPQARTEFAR
jgi:hypothetical protein